VVGAYDAIYGAGPATVVIKAGGNAGNITINNLSTDPGADGLEDVKINVVGTLGTVTITATGGAAMNNSIIDPTSITSVTLAGAFAMNNNSAIISTGTIGAVTLNGDLGTGSSLEATTSIGNITGNGTGNQFLTIKAPTVGDISFTKLGAATTAKLTIDGSVLTIGNVTATAPTGEANLFTQRDGVSAINLLSTLGNVNVDGNWTADNDLPFITQIGTVTVGGGIGGGNIIGAATGAKITAANSGNVSVGSITAAAGNSVTFRVMDTATAFTGDFIIDGTSYTDQTAAPYNGTPVDGLLVTLI